MVIDIVVVPIGFVDDSDCDVNDGVVEMIGVVVVCDDDDDND